MSLISSASILGVLMAPGWTVFTRMLYSTYSCATAFVKPVTANLEALYIEFPAVPRKPSRDDIFTIDPPPAFYIEVELFAFRETS